MAYTFKDFRSDCSHGGREMAAAFTPPIMHPFTVPVLGAILSVAVSPVLLGGSIAFEKLAEA